VVQELLSAAGVKALSGMLWKGLSRPMNILSLSKEDRMKVAGQIKKHNRLMKLFARAAVRCYHEMAAKELCRDFAGDLMIIGYRATREKWFKFLEWHYGKAR